MYEPYSTYKAIITQTRNGVTKVIKTKCRDYESSMYTLTLEDVADFFDHFSPEGRWEMKLKEHDTEDGTFRMEIFVDVDAESPMMKKWKEWHLCD